MNTQLKVLVTGANGLLGTNTIIELLKQGYQVIGLVRNSDNYIGEYHKNLTLEEGDILDLHSLEKALMGCTYVIHTASISSPKISKYKTFEEINVHGTKNLIDAALKQKVKKVIYIGTANIFGFGTLENLGHEHNPIKSPFTKSFYSQSKLKAQELALSKSSAMEVVSINPAFMIGGYDSKPSSGVIVLRGLNKRIIFYPPGGKSFVCVTDVVQAIINSFDLGQSGEAYIVTNENLTFKAFYQMLNRKQKRKATLIKIPKYILLLAGLFGDGLNRMGLVTSFTSNNLRLLCINSYYSNEKTKLHLRVNFTPLEEGLEDAISWFESQQS
ncbi:NAD-dependent epimerase/dehydratase family protein [Aestuariibaculum sediminum]|uniref:NAD-dependent epimerase/dehydratase family protein n=1 Tax=Aestuariibaculum sediminum TaxID=2770637 RepID=A0A8J6UH48_9FLAO|nr:NAD-dependent epimerase/dehydratase family protein [Aestuariibaculum sediminum]MBD0832456.1 NAD-dependent epimerase/dehydratase family protein [Aestuariibaculum sediminum]